jgi:dihydrofolate reductase
VRRVIFSINVTLDGMIDHTAGIADDESHRHFTDMLNAVDTLLFGRRNYQLLAEYWPTAERNSSLTPGEIAFARRVNSMPKIVFSNTLASVEWKNTQLIKGDAVEQVAKLKQQPGGDLAVGGNALARSLMEHDLIDEYQFLIHPVVFGRGPRLLENVSKKNLKLTGTKTFRSGIVLVSYEPDRQQTK